MFQDDLRQEISDSHCGYASEDMVVMMITAQRYKNANGKKHNRSVVNKSKAVPIVGGGHTVTTGVWYCTWMRK